MRTSIKAYRHWSAGQAFAARPRSLPMVVDWDEAEPLEDDDDEPEGRWRRFLKRFSAFLPIKT